MFPKIAYLINQYPKVSHSFIRREILALEAEGLEVARFAIRACEAELVDDGDRSELAKTQVVLGGSKVNLLIALLKVALTRPTSFLKTLALATKIGWRSERGLLLHLVYVAEACLLLQWFTRQKIDHVHAHFGTNSTTVAMFCQALGGPSYSFTVHGPEEFDKVQAIALPEKIQRAEFVVAISSFGRSQLYRWCAADLWSKIHVVPCGVDNDFLNSLLASVPDNQQLVCVGRLCEQKGQLLLLEAARSLVDQGFTFNLLLVGDGPLRKEIESRIQQLNLQGVVHITGWASNDVVRKHILASRALVLPSFAEGLPVVIMEALALGRPVISTYIAGIPELVKPLGNGWLIPSGSVVELTQAMKEALLASPETLEEFGKFGHSQIVDRHNTEIIGRQLSELFQKFVRSSSWVGR